ENGDGLNTTVNKNKSKACPPWLVANGTAWEVDESKKAIFKKIAALSLHMGIGQIQDKLKLGAGWKNLNRICRSKALIGEYQPKQRINGKKVNAACEPIKGYYPPVLTEAEFYAMQTALDGRTKAVGRKGVNGEESNLFTHILFDALDGMKMN